MKKGLKRAVAIAGAIAMLGGTVGALAACNNNPDEEKSLELVEPVGEARDKVTYNTYTVVMPSNWNILTYEDNNDTQIMDYLSTALFDYDFKFDGDKFVDGKVNTDAIIADDFDTVFAAATGLKDVTADYSAKFGLYDEVDVPVYDEESGELLGYDVDYVPATEGYCWEITLRQDLKWDDGTEIKAEDFIYSMQQQLAPEFQNYRASTYYGATNVVGAKNYVYQGQKGWFAASTAFDHSEYTTEMDSRLVFTIGSTKENSATGGAISSFREWLEGQLGTADFTAAQAAGVTIANFAPDMTPEDFAALEGKTLAEIKADEALNASWQQVIGFWQTDPGEEMDFCVIEHTWPEYDFEDVGFFKTGDYKFVVCYTSPSEYLKEDGSLSYLAAYEMSSFPLVHKVKYEASKIAPGTGSTLWTSNYNSSLATTASWGPYKLTAFQSGKMYMLEKNEYWYGYALDEFKDQYLVDRIYCEKLTQSNTQWMSFLGGAIDSIGIDVTHADAYRDSKYAYFTPGTYTFSWHLNADLAKLKTSGRNNGILAITDFRKALSLSIDRNQYANSITTAYQGYYGFLNETYYYDVVNNGIYRETEPAKEAILRAYGYTKNSDGTWSLEGNANIQNKTLDEAYKTVTGYNPTLAKEYLMSAYEELTANAEEYGYDASKPIQIKFGTSEDNADVRREFDLCQSIINTLTKDTPLEGKIQLVFDSSFGTDWANKFRAGEYELCTSAWGGASFNPCYLIGAYIEAASTFTTYWDTTAEMITVKMPDGDYALAGQEVEISVMNAYLSLNGLDGASYNWQSGGAIPEIARLTVLAAVEECILTHYYSIPTITQYSATLLGAKFSYASEEYNTFMSYGGLRYIRVNYNDGEWYDFAVKEHGRDLSSEYKKTL